MIFVGDTAVPSHIRFDTDEIEKVFGSQTVIANLEGPILKKHQEKKYLEKKVLFNGNEHISSLKRMGVRLCNLANNHITDVPYGLETTRTLLKQSNIQYVGAGANKDEASSPVMLQQDGNKFIFLSFGWETIQCIAADNKKPGVNPLRGSSIIQSVSDIQTKYPEAVLILLMHWNYELEDYPQPFDRQLARRCIDKGADAVIGCHSHCVQGIEIYKKAPIVYSLGNWFIPHNTFFTGRLRFPAKSFLQLAFEWEPGREPCCHWFFYEPDNHNLKYLQTESLSDSKRIHHLTPYRGYGHKRYKKWFKKNRVKKKMLPIFKNTDDIFLNAVKHHWVSLRDRLINILLDLGLKKVRNDT